MYSPTLAKVGSRLLPHCTDSVNPDPSARRGLIQYLALHLGAVFSFTDGEGHVGVEFIRIWGKRGCQIIAWLLFLVLLTFGNGNSTLGDIFFFIQKRTVGEKFKNKKTLEIP